MRKVLEGLDFESLLQCRVVSKSWEKEATWVASKKCRITFRSVDSIQDFVNMAPRYTEETLFTHVNFTFDVNSVSEKNEVLESFLERHAKVMKSVETPDGLFSEADSVQEWINKMLVSIKAKPEENPAEIFVDENDNYVHPADDNTLQEIVINDEVEETKVKQLSNPKKLKTVHFSMVENPDYVPIPYSEDGYETFADFYPYYLGEHSNEKGRRMHILGITNSIILIIIGTFTLTPILYAVALVQAYALAIGAHYYFDKHIPRPTIRNPVYMVSFICLHAL